MMDRRIRQTGWGFRGRCLGYCDFAPDLTHHIQPHRLFDTLQLHRAEGVEGVVGLLLEE